MQVASLKACAKVNLYLYVEGKRDDGKHNINSLVVPLSLHDEINVYKAGKFEIVSDIANNNMHGVVDYFKERYPTLNFDLKIVLKKNIPIASGLGGSSTDAAALINFINDYYKLNLSTEERRTIASHFGSDMAYFIDPLPAIISGDGSIVTPKSVGCKYYIVLVYPGFEIQSKDCYRLGFESFSSPTTTPQSEIINGVNHLENNAIALNSKIAQLISEMASTNGCKVARMSGSGSSIFGIFDRQEDMLAAKDKFAQYWTYSEFMEI